jgi:hypothetical protein
MFATDPKNRKFSHKSRFRNFVLIFGGNPPRVSCVYRLYRMRLLLVLNSHWRMERWYLTTGHASCFFSKLFLFTEHNQLIPF